MAAATSPADLALQHHVGVSGRDGGARRWLVVRNPVAGRSRQPHAWRRFERALRDAGVACDVVQTRAPGDAATLAAEAAAAGIDRYFVAGGDGSAHEVVNGLMQARARGVADGSPTVVPVPLGTGNDWARSLALPRDPERLVALAQRGTTRPHDVGRIDFPATGAATRWFVNVAGAGFDAHVIAGLPALTPSRLAYLGGALRQLARYDAPRLRLEYDAAAPVEGRFLLAFVAIGRYCGHRMCVAPTARVDDALFDVVTIDAVGLLRALPKLLRLYRGTLLEDPLVRRVQAARVALASVPAALVEADGQLVGRAPAIFTTVPAALRVPCDRVGA